MGRYSSPKNRSETHQETLEQQYKDWQQKQLQHQVKKASYQIGLETQAYEDLLQALEALQAKYSSKKETLDNFTKKYYSLKFAKLKQELHHFEEEIIFAENEMEKLKEKEELQDVEDNLEKAKQALLGCFLDEMDGIKKEIENIQYELNPIDEQIEKTEEDIATNKKSQQTKQNEWTSVKTTIQTRWSDMEHLEQLLLANPQQEQVEQKIIEWQKRYQFLDEELIRLHAEIKAKQKEQTELEHVNEQQRETKNEWERELQNIQSEKEQELLFKKLRRLRPQWATLDSVYEHEQSILNRLTETINKLKNEKKELLYKERVAHRLVDDYQHQTTFFSDPIIEKRMNTWKNQLDYCVTGIEYLQALKEEDYQKKASYPLWAVTIITTKKSKETLQRKLAELSDQLRSPIQIMTTEEASMIGEDTFQQEYEWMIPSYWQKGLMEETFEQWKQKIRMEAASSTHARHAKEEEIKEWENGLLAFQEFMEKNPYAMITELQAKQSEIVLTIDQLKREIERNAEKKKELLRHLSQMEQTIERYRDERIGLERKIEEGNKYLQYKREVEIAKEKEKRLSEELQAIEHKLQRLQSQWSDYNEQKEFLTDRKRKFEFHLDSLEKDEQYKEVNQLSPIFTGESKKIIQEKIRTLEMKIHQITTSYGELHAKLTNAQDNKNRIMNEMNQLKDEQENIEEHMEFPSDGEELLHKINRKMKKLHTELIHVEEVKKKTSAKDKQQGKLENLIKRFSTDFPEQEIIPFTDSLDKIEKELHQEKQALADEKKYVDDQLQQVKKEKKVIEEAIRLFERYIEKHHFNAPQVEALDLSPNEKMEFHYNRKKMTQQIIEELEQKSEEVEKKKNRVEQQKQTFKQFCLSIDDIKLRKMAENGVEYKTNYDDLLNFKKNMMTSVERATNYANEHIRQKDEELQAYINQIHAHLKTVVDELKQIPKNTKVKVDDQWKTIYMFTIPEWEEKEGKQRIRDHIEWIMAQLQSDRYMKEDGIQDEAKIRKDIEMWLQTKQLLQTVMKNETMKVSCRKVTNENKVTSRAYSWEQSNVWSGGEKWSKNMTLFLGLLNYVAEKKQHKQTKLKHNRAVILDNPFGKASSDHVLSPVFFVAEQLGFQIIALTAHVEGKFLQDYFPIIYSCRLRDSKEANKQIVTKEKWLHAAFFQDHEPETLERLTETKQISLF